MKSSIAAIILGFCGVAIFCGFVFLGGEKSRAPRVETATARVVPAQVVPQSDDYHIGMVEAAVREKGFSGNLLRALIHVESGGRHEAERHEPKLGTSSVGLTQVLGTTAAIYGVKKHELRDRETSIWVGGLYLRDCLRHESGDIKFGLACYNAGPRKKRHYPAAALCYADKVKGVYEQIKRGEKADSIRVSPRRCAANARSSAPKSRSRRRESGFAIVSRTHERGDRAAYAATTGAAATQRKGGGASRANVARG